MESLKEKLPMIIAVIIVLVLMVSAVYLLFIQKKDYYTRIDNTKIEQVSNTDDMKYQYTLTVYDEGGKTKEISFKTSRELTEGAYLKLEVMSIRGVVSWEEVQETELPDKVKTEINQ